MEKKPELMTLKRMFPFLMCEPQLGTDSNKENLLYKARQKCKIMTFIR